MSKRPDPESLHVTPPAARRKCAQALRQLAEGKRFTPAERKELGRMADAWQKTLPEQSHK